ncbi:hypothetical protein ACPPVO_43145 [Dactylosporangium sp. McL0621]|uniref:hypothetical protein n=1 Tax=Dactylosporangium sp. McL0621 TaxID=3415678 RepID=UPI003CF4B94D
MPDVAGQQLNLALPSWDAGVVQSSAGSFSILLSKQGLPIRVDDCPLDGQSGATCADETLESCLYVTTDDESSSGLRRAVLSDHRLPHGRVIRRRKSAGCIDHLSCQAASNSSSSDIW